MVPPHLRLKEKSSLSTHRQREHTTLALKQLIALCNQIQRHIWVKHVQFKKVPFSLLCPWKGWHLEICGQSCYSGHSFYTECHGQGWQFSHLSRKVRITLQWSTDITHFLKGRFLVLHKRGPYSVIRDAFKSKSVDRGAFLRHNPWIGCIFSEHTGKRLGWVLESCLWSRYM